MENETGDNYALLISAQDKPSYLDTSATIINGESASCRTAINHDKYSHCSKTCGHMFCIRVFHFNNMTSHDCLENIRMMA
jgi:hypothetical protein